MEDCIFYKIVKGEIPSIKIWEDQKVLEFRLNFWMLEMSPHPKGCGLLETSRHKNFIAILDINPNTEGMTLVIPKKHFDSYVFDIADENYYKKFMIATKKVAKLLDKKLNVQRTALVMEGLGVNHAHNKLCPIHGLEKKFEEKWAKERVYFLTYKGYISTQLGPQKSIEELKKIAEKIITSKSPSRFTAPLKVRFVWDFWMLKMSSILT